MTRVVALGPSFVGSCVAGLLLATASLAAADEPAPAAVSAPTPPNTALSYEKDVRPIFKAFCFDCHGAGGEKKGDLDLRLRRLAVAGGESGPAITPGDANKSLLLEKLRAGEMPPGEKKLPADQVARIEAWIAAGAPTLRDEPADVGPEDITPEERGYWAFQPPVMPPLPSFGAADRVRTSIDAVIFGRLREKGLSFSPDADRTTLIRRAAFDLLGLPPTPDEVARFVADPAPDAYEQLVDRLLASPQYGERWGRHWLDVAGYADSRGSTTDAPRPFAFKYRDWVIRALNADMPLSQFLIEQLAGDELVPQPHKNLTPEQIDKLTATGFLRMSVDATGLVPDLEQAANQVVSDTIKIVSSSLLGLTVGCAQCHDHRYDPISQRDYYALRAVFEPALNPAHWRFDAQRSVTLNSEEELARSAAIEAEAVKIIAERKTRETELLEVELEKELAKLDDELTGALRLAWHTPKDKRTAEQAKILMESPRVGGLSPGSLYLYSPPAAAELKTFMDRAAAVRATKPAENLISVLSEVPGETPVTHLYYRGDLKQPRDEVLPADLTIASPPGTRFTIPPHDPALATTGRRLAWARHLVDGSHPLVGRVLVNRIWLHHFGRPLVDTPGDFGVLGSRPNLPELLDLLAVELVRCEWSLKRLHRLIMTSTVYRQSSHADAAKEAIDASNGLYWRMPLVRLDAEALRDRMLATAGILDSQQFGPAVPVEADATGQVVVKSDLPRRSIYLQVQRTKPVSFLTVFDAPVMETNCDRRLSSTVATQSLMMMNSQVVLSRAAAFAERLARETPPDFPAPDNWRYQSGAAQWQFGAGHVDCASDRVADFRPLASWTGSAWNGMPGNGTAQTSDPALAFVSLSRASAQPCDSLHAAIRRWIAPADGVLSIDGSISHPSAEGDGVVAAIVSSRTGTAGRWAAKKSKITIAAGPLEVKQGDTIDFVLDALESTDGDATETLLDLRLARADGSPIGHWNSAGDFSGPSQPSLASQVAYAWQLAFARPITADELSVVGPFLSQRVDDLGHALDADPARAAMADLTQQLLSANEFLYVD
ncbi:MAG TPA: PSD1 and planctomycete cytochrome C domain-containing protein [Pirellulales bacterium]|nr:PSD1 and planctomycete cytochrome C domain-containing protein [Pirellulales bacterium]